jgi:hypothetical protein
LRGSGRKKTTALMSKLLWYLWTIIFEKISHGVEVKFSIETTIELLEIEQLPTNIYISSLYSNNTFLPSHFITIHSFFLTSGHFWFKRRISWLSLILAVAKTSWENSKALSISDWSKNINKCNQCGKSQWKIKLNKVKKQ